MGARTSQKAAARFQISWASSTVRMDVIVMLTLAPCTAAATARLATLPMAPTTRATPALPSSTPVQASPPAACNSQPILAASVSARPAAWTSS
ncbi:hypothetical protein ASC95_21475 [Pelomonas sp. Root1217]|nr:hypothetical protein ASC95_21475 [Pelomonas sp. Root1217]